MRVGATTNVSNGVMYNQNLVDLERWAKHSLITKLVEEILKRNPKITYIEDRYFGDSTSFRADMVVFTEAEWLDLCCEYHIPPDRGN